MNPPARDWAADLGLPDDVGILARLVRLDLLVRRVLDDIAGAADIAVADYLVLAVVRRSPGHQTTPTRICEVLDRTSGGMSLALDRLVAAGWLTRSSDPDDGRRVVVTLTPSGLTLATRVNDALHEWEASLDLSAAQQRETARVVDQLLERFERRGSQSSTAVSSPVSTA